MIFLIFISFHVNSTVKIYENLYTHKDYTPKSFLIYVIITSIEKHFDLGLSVQKGSVYNGCKSAFCSML